MSDDQRRDKELLWKFLLNEYGSTISERTEKGATKHTPRAYVLLSAIDMAFSGYSNRKLEVHGVPVDRELVQYLAGYSLYRNEDDELHGMHFINRAFDAFVETIRKAARKGQLRFDSDGVIRFGCLALPKWIVDKYIAEAQEEAEHYKLLWEKNEDGFQADFGNDIHLFLNLTD